QPQEHSTMANKDNLSEYQDYRAREIIRERVAQFRPWIKVAGQQQIANLRLEPLHALLGWARAQIPVTGCFITVRSKRVAEEVEPLPSLISQRVLVLVECHPKPRHPRLRPRQCLGRVSATEDDEVISIHDNTCAKFFAAFGQPPILEEPVHI